MSKKLINEIRACTVCKKYLPFPPKPVLNFSTTSRIVIIGQAPGIKVQESGIPWNDASGKRLREWMKVSDADFYDPKKFAIVPMGFCYPGKGSSGDLPPRPECAEIWMERILNTLKQKELILLIGQYSQKYFLQEMSKPRLTDTVKHWREYLPDYFVLPHPSPRNNIWLRKNAWFEEDVIPSLQNRIRQISVD
ncbi:MAG: uracil-DNA glycosylase [Gammaproteobacteria bacterium]